ncbi:MAG: response regulator [Enterocloster asparagiformis]|nr:response regulator [Enterocloster asparagiformis]
MGKRSAGSAKRRIALAAAGIGAVLCLLTFLFAQGVKTQLWEQSVGTIIESTRQGCNTLRVQLRDEFWAMSTVVDDIKKYSSDQEAELDALMEAYRRVDDGVSLYLEKRCLPSGVQTDENAHAVLRENDRANGMIDPHISSVTGVNVFNLFIRVTLKDGRTCFLVKEYEIERIVDSFTLSFYNGAGFSYVVDSEGNVLIRPPHPGSNKTVQNLFDMLPETENDPDSLAQFNLALQNARTGWAVFSYQGEKTVFCYTPLKLQSDWYLISIIPQQVVNAQTNQILQRALALIASIIAGILALAAYYVHYANRTNRKLKNQAQYISHLYNAIPEGIAVLSVEAPYQFIQLNQEGLRLLGYPVEASNDALRDQFLRDVVPSGEYTSVAGVFREAEASGGKRKLENRLVREDREVFWAGGIVEKTLDENGQPVFVITFHDITAEKLAAEEAKREQLQERITLVGAISNAYPLIISINLTRDTLNFVNVEPGILSGLGEQRAYSALYQDFAAAIHPDHLEEFKERFAPENLRRILGRERGEVFLEARQRLMDGNYHWVSLQIISVDNPYSGDKLAILISRRIDEQRYEEEQQRQALQSALDSARLASQAKSQFLSNMSHDIRTPMNAIVGMTAIAAAHLSDKDRVAECLKKIGLSSQHLLSLINDVLDMSKIESGKLTLREEPFNFAELTADVAELIRPTALDGRLSLDIRMANLAQENVLGDSLRIRQVFINILSNAVKYTPAGGSIRVEVRQEPGPHRGYQSYVFSCADTGIGMEAEFLDRLFQPFERVQDSTVARITGTGLGMAITKNLVDLMNGEIQVESKPGMGSLFTVTLPLKLQEAPEQEVPGQWRGVRCLIVDDDQQTCENAVELLADMGLCPEFVTKGAEAVSAVARAVRTPDPFRLVIVDWKMPEMDGAETARRIRAEAGADIPVIVLTAYDWSEIESEARQAGVTAFLSKPFYRTKICYLLGELSGGNGQTEQRAAEFGLDFAGRRVLLVEDNEINREIARTLVEERGILVEEAGDGQEAVDMVIESAEGYYDLILMDIQMPRMNGYEAARAIRALQREDVEKLPIIAMTANAFEEDVRAALRDGMDAHFAKPIDIKELDKLLCTYLSGVNRS